MPNVPAPLAPSQQRLLAVNMLRPGRTDVWSRVEIGGELAPGEVLDALARLVERQDALRYAFVAGDDGPMQVPQPWRPRLDADVRSGGHPLPADLRAAEGEVIERLQAVELDPFDGAMFASGVAGTADRTVIYLRMLHVVSDQWSSGIVSAELPDALSATGPLPPLPFSLADYARRAADAWLGPGRGRFVRYWQETLRGAAPAELPLGGRRFTVNPTSPAGGLTGTVTTAAQLRAVARRWRVPPSALAFATVFATFHALTGQEDLVLSSIVADRLRPAQVATVGCMVNPVFLRARVTGDGDLPADVARSFFGAVSHQSGWWSDLKADVPEAAALISRTRPQAQVEFLPASAVAGRIGPPPDPGRHRRDDGITLGEAERRPGNDLEFRFVEGDDLTCSITYRTDLWDQDGIVGLFSVLRREAARLGL